MKLLNIRKKDYDHIYKIVSSRSVMQYIGNGKVWDEEKLHNFILYNLEEQKLDHSKREYYYYRIVDDEELIGIIGFYLSKDKWNLRVFIKNSEQGKGYFKQALKQLLKRLKEYKNIDLLYSQVHQKNEKMNSIMLDKYYFDKTFNIGKIKVNQYIIFNRPYTYLIKSDYISHNTIKEVFKSRKQWIEWDKSISKNPDFLHLDGTHYYDKGNQKYNVFLKNIMNNKHNPAIEKTSLFKILSKKFTHSKDYLPQTFYFDKHKDKLENLKHLFLENKPYIIKPDGGYSGSGIKIITTLNELKYIYRSRHQKWSIQEYITDPVLIDERKFHIRVLYIQRDDGKGFVFEKMPIYRAQKPFVLENYDDEDIHISHYSEKDKELYLDELQTYLNVSDVKKQINSILKDINNIVNNSCYFETKNCYEMYGVDFMLIGSENKCNVKLLEFNNKIGLKEFVNPRFAFNKNLLESELEITCDYYFPNLNKIKEYKESYFTEIN